MGVIDGINRTYFAVTKPFNALGNARLGTKLLRSGIEATARIDGIKTTRTESTSNQRVWIFAVTVRPGSPLATVLGDPVEVTLWAVGRTSVADVNYSGDPDALAALTSLRPRL